MDLINLQGKSTEEKKSILKELDKDILLDFVLETSKNMFKDQSFNNLIEYILHSNEKYHPEKIKAIKKSDNKLNILFEKEFITDIIDTTSKKCWDTLTFFDKNIKTLQDNYSSSDDFVSLFYARKMNLYSTYKVIQINKFLEINGLDFASSVFWENPTTRKPIYDKILSLLFYYTNYQEQSIESISEKKERMFTWNGTMTGIIALMMKLEESEMIEGLNFFGDGEINWSMLYNHINFPHFKHNSTTWSNCYKNKDDSTIINNEISNKIEKLPSFECLGLSPKYKKMKK